MAEITNLFKATVKTMKTRLKSQGGSLPTVDKSMLGPGGRIHKREEFEVKSKEVASNITQLRDFLIEHRKDYIDILSHFARTSHMTDAERDQIDADAEKYIKLCSESIKALKSKGCQNKESQQIQEHKKAVLSLLEAYLKAICSIYSEQRAVRVKRVVDRKRMSRLEPERKKSKQTESSQAADSKAKEDEKTEPEKSESTTSQSSSNPPEQQDNVPSQEETLSPEELQMFEEENKQLYEDMNSMVDEVKQIEGKVVEISRLQEIFAEKVLDQDADIDRIADTVVGTTENIKEANEEIREAMKNNAGLRVWILFFLIVCSFSLLFLDWYNA